MESKFYYFPGQTPSNTKIVNRAHALHITSGAWGNITKHLDRRRLIEEAIQKEKAHKKALKDGSNAMTKEWPNSIENLRISKKKQKEAELEAKKAEKEAQFIQMRKEMAAERAVFIARRKKEIFTSTGAAKKLTSALVLSETLYERQKQQEFAAKLKQHDMDVEAAFVDKLRRETLEEQKAKDEQKREQLEQNKRYALELRQQIVANETELKASQRRKALQEADENRNAAEEERQLDEIEAREKVRKRMQTMHDQQKQIEHQRRRDRTQKEEDKELDEAVELYANAKHRINCMMKDNEKRLRAEGIQKRADTVLMMQAKKEPGSKAQDEEELRWAKAVKERDERDEAARLAKEEARQKAIMDRVKNREDYLKRAADEKYTEEELKRWEMLNRIKTMEVIQTHNAEIEEREWAKKMAYRKELKDQMAKQEEYAMEEQAMEKEFDDYVIKTNNDDKDKMFLDYAEECTELAKKGNRATYPIEKVLADYKKTFGLQPKTNKCRCCRK